ncbi:hypothetical protein PMAYCL1PPCAC_20714, partial [Pristionchus mayeri]
ESDGEDEPSAKKSKSESDEMRDKKSEVDDDSSDDDEDGEEEMMKDDEKKGEQKDHGDHSMESQLLKTVLEVCNDEKTVKRVSKQMDEITKNMTDKSIARVFSKALTKLPHSDRWHIVNKALLKQPESGKCQTKKMAKAEKIERNKVIPKAERNFFELLKSLIKIKRFKGLFDCFYE